MLGTGEKVISKIEGLSAWNSKTSDAHDKYYFVDIKYDIMKKVNN